MLRKLFLISLALVAITGLLSPAQAVMCTKRSELLTALDTRYHERAQAIGLISKRGVLEVYASQKGTWTVFVTNPNGISCVVASGEAFEQMPKAGSIIDGPDA